MTLEDDLTAVREATAGLLAHLDALSVDELAGPSDLPGWTRSHVVAHLAGNALSHVRMLEGCLSGEVRQQYADGASGRTAAIKELAADGPAAVAAHRSACEALCGCWAAMGREHWARDVLPLDRAPRPARGLVWSRTREVQVHRVDLAADYGPADWPEEFAVRLLAQLLDRDDLPPLTLDAGRGPLPVSGGGQRVAGSPAALTAWLSGRSDGADLETDGPLPAIPDWA